VARGLVWVLNYLFDPSRTLARLEEAERHVRDGEARVERQRALVAQMQAHGHPTDEAETLLMRFQDIQKEHVFHRDRLKKELQRNSV
jgi:multidrug resistance efflux pump